MAGELADVNDEVAKLYNLPMGGAAIDLRELVPALIRFLLANREKLSGNPVDLAMKRLRLRLRLDCDRLALEQSRREWLRREDVERMLVDMAGVLRRGIERFRFSRFGGEAAGILEETLEAYGDAVQRRMGLNIGGDAGKVDEIAISSAVTADPEVLDDGRCPTCGGRMAPGDDTVKAP